MKPSVLALISLIPIFSLFGCRRSRGVPNEVTNAEYQVLSVYTTSKYKSVVGVGQIVILSETRAMGEDLDGHPASKTAVSALKTAHGPLFRVFLDVNRHSSTLHRSFTLPVNYQIADSVEMRSTFGTPGDIWGRYYQKYPGSQGILELSRVGFSPDGRQAAFYFSNHCGSLCGEARFVIMEKQADSTWRIVEDTQLWIS